jgi:alcohol dehydrogenase (cytochrome c)
VDVQCRTGINAPAIAYSVNGKEYVAVLAGSKQSPFVMGNRPELKNSAPASMLFVFSL